MEARRQRPVRLGLVGIGRWGRILCPKLARHGELTAVCATGGPDGRRWVAEHLRDVAYVSEVDELLAMPIDAVVIASPRSTHESLVDAALASGRHVLVEKPLATTSAAAARLLDLADAADLVLSVDYTHIHDASFEALCGRVGDHGSLELEWQRPGVPSIDDVLLELCPHVAAMALSFDPAIRVEQAHAEASTEMARVDARFVGDAVVFDAHVAMGRIGRSKQLTTRGPDDEPALVWTDRRLEERRGSTVATVHEAVDEPLDRVVATFVDEVAARRDGQAIDRSWPPAAVRTTTPELLDDLISLVRRSRDSSRTGSSPPR